MPSIKALIDKGAGVIFARPRVAPEKTDSPPVLALHLTGGVQGEEMNGLIVERPLTVLPGLAVRIGLKQAILLQALHEASFDSEADESGHRWVRGGVGRLATEMFPMFSEATVKRLVAELVERGLLVAQARSSDPADRTLSYRVDVHAVSRGAK